MAAAHVARLDASNPGLLAVFYMDGHVRAYQGRGQGRQDQPIPVEGCVRAPGASVSQGPFGTGEATLAPPHLERPGHLSARRPEVAAGCVDAPERPAPARRSRFRGPRTRPPCGAPVGRRRPQRGGIRTGWKARSHTTQRARRLDQGSWSFIAGLSRQHPSRRRATRPSMPGSSRRTTNSLIWSLFVRKGWRNGRVRE